MYVTFDEYSKLYDNVTDKATFSKLEARACAIVDTATHGRASGVMGYKLQCVKNSVMRLVNLLNAEGESAGTGVTSFSNDGYSETNALQTAEAVSANQRALLFDCLSGTGLMGAL